MNDTDVMKVARAGRDLGELKAVKDRKGEITRATANGLTSCKRFTPGLDLMYSIKFPFRIQ